MVEQPERAVESGVINALGVLGMDWSKADPKLVETIVRQGEVYLEAQLTLATSADQRASMMASIFAAAGAVILGALVTVWSDSPPGAGPVIVAGAVVAGMFLLAAGLCVWATLPADFDLAGNEPDSYKCEVQAGTDVHTALIDEAQNYQAKIDRNDKALRSNAGKFKAGAVIGVVAPLAGFGAWLIAAYC